MSDPSTPPGISFVPPAPQQAPPATPALSIAIPLSLALSLASICFAAGGSYVTVATTAARQAAVEARLADHISAPAHPVASQRMNEIEHHLDDLGHVVATMNATHDDVVRIAANVRALCQASRAANCAP
ncbi:MAG TPA: hypothetical protein VIU64_11830 [Polyangia bacterium]